jgi:SAM-dependent methyltransferase
MPRDRDIAVRSQSFGGIAGDYARFRPGPPEEAVQWLLPPGAVDVLEIGAGTGALSRLLVERVAHVRALEPDARMRAVLATRVPEVEIVAASAEQIPADDGSFDAVIGASSWHWVDEAKGLPEVARVLRPGGTFALLWSGADRSVDWLRSLWAGGRELSAEDSDAEDTYRRHRHVVNLPEDTPFLEPERRMIHWTRPMTREELLAMAGTYSGVITMGETERRDHLAAMARFLDSHPLPEVDGVIEVPMRCLCWRTTLG